MEIYPVRFKLNREGKKSAAHQPQMFTFFAAAPERFSEANRMFILICNNREHIHFDYKSNKNVCVVNIR